MRDYFLFFTSRKKPDHQKALLTLNDYDQPTTPAGDYNNPTAAMALLLKSWLNANRLRYIILILCSPIIIPIACAIFPFICAAEVCFRICRRQRLKSEEEVVVAPPKPKEDVNKKEMSLLERYLDDQLELAIEILDECGGELGLGFGCDFLDDDYFDCNYHINNDNNNSSDNSLC